MVRYIKYSIPDGVLCLLMTVGLSMNIYQGFLLPAALSVAWLRAAVVSGIFLVFLFWAAYSRRTVLIGTILVIVFVIAAIVILYVMDIPLIETTDAEANSALWYALTLLVALGVFLASRRYAGSLALLAAGVFLHGLIAAMLYTFYLPALIVFLVTCIVMILFKRYQRNIFQTDTRRAAFFPMLGYACGLTGAAIGLACAVWFGILAQFAIPALNIQLITNLVSIETLEVMGISKEMEILNQELFSSIINEDEVKESSELGDDEENIPEEEQEDEDDTGGEEDALNLGNGFTASNAVNYLSNIWEILFKSVLFWILVAVAALIVIALIANRRKLWWRKMEELPPKRRVAYLYEWTLVRLRRLKFPARGSRTPDEYAELTADKLRFLQTEQAGFRDITALMVQVCYADITPDEEQESLLADFYKNFHKNCRKHLGWRYIYMYFRL